MRVMGVEPATKTLDSAGKPHVSSPGAAKVAVVGCPPVGAGAVGGGPAGPGLRAVVDAWPMLPEPIKTGILAIVRATLPPPPKPVRICAPLPRRSGWAPLSKNYPLS
jgi:hypothetical protein